MSEFILSIIIAVGIIVLGVAGAMLACFIMDAIRYAILSALFAWISTADKFIRDNPYKFMAGLIWILIADPWKRIFIDHSVTELSHGGWILDIASGRIKYECDCE